MTRIGTNSDFARHIGSIFDDLADPIKSFPMDQPGAALQNSRVESGLVERHETFSGAFHYVLEYVTKSQFAGSLVPSSSCASQFFNPILSTVSSSAES
jgi:hypothetical protein